MTKAFDDSVYDAFLAETATAGQLVLLDTGTPANFAAADVGGANHIATKTITPGLGGGSFGSATNGSPDGRTTQVAAVTTDVATAAKTASHVALLGPTGLILCVNELDSSQAVALGNPADVPAWNINIPDPV